ncbi:hypothetical protein ACLKA7_010865 [Drosophila subpalustris]
MRCTSFQQQQQQQQMDSSVASAIKEAASHGACSAEERSAIAIGNWRGLGRTWRDLDCRRNWTASFRDIACQSEILAGDT